MRELVYFCRGGPWDGTWVKHGFKPRVRVQSAMYQVLLFPCVRDNFLRSPYLLSKCTKVDTTENLPLVHNFSNTMKTIHAQILNQLVIPAALEPRMQKLLKHGADAKVWFLNQQITTKRFRSQLCDMPAAVQKLLHTAKRLHACDSSTGWFHSHVLKKVRELLVPYIEAAVLRAELAAGLVTSAHAPQITVLSASTDELTVGLDSTTRENTVTTTSTQETSYEPFELLGASDDDDDDESDAEGVLFLDI